MVLATAAWVPVGSASAQDAPAGDTTSEGALDFGNSDKPIEVSAENGIEWRRDAKSYTARGNAIATQNDSADLGGFADRHGAGDNSIDRLLAEASVRIQTRPRPATGGRADWWTPMKKLLVMTGSALKIETPKGMTGPRLAGVLAGSRRLVARGDTYRAGNTRFRAIRPDISANNDAGKKELYQIQADGNVRIDTGKSSPCAKAVA